MEASSGSPHRRRSARARREQRLRAEARLVQRMLRSFAELGKHRGGRPSKLGLALEVALKDVVASGQAANDPAGSGPAQASSPRRPNNPSTARPADSGGPQECGAHSQEWILEGEFQMQAKFQRKDLA